MKYRFVYPSNSIKIADSFIAWVQTVFYDFCITVIINILIFLPTLLIIEYTYVIVMNADEVPVSFIKTSYSVIFIIEILFIAFIEIKRRFTYCELKSYGLYIYNNNGMKFGYGNWYKRNATIPYSQIELCYISKADFVPKNYWKQIWFISMFRYLNRKINKSSTYDYIPAIANGNYKSNCIIIELKNKKAVVLPIDDCDDFLSKYNSIINQGS